MSSGFISPNGTKSNPGWYTCRSSRSTTVMSSPPGSAERRSRFAVSVPPVPPPRITTFFGITSKKTAYCHRAARCERPDFRDQVASQRSSRRSLLTSGRAIFPVQRWYFLEPPSFGARCRQDPPELECQKSGFGGIEGHEERSNQTDSDEGRERASIQ